MAEYRAMDFRDDVDLRRSRVEIVRLARGLLDETEPFLDAVRALACQRFRLSRDGFDPDFTIFVAIDSQTDHMPGAGVRRLARRRGWKNAMRTSRAWQPSTRARLRRPASH